MKKLYLVDVSSFFFRAFYAIPHLTSPGGMPTNALYGFLSMTIKLLREIKPDYLAYCFDRKDGSFRLELYSEYKANRSEMPEDLVPQVPFVKELTDLLGIPRFELKGFEADDLIGSLVTKGLSEGLEVVIVSGDKDFAQLIGPSVTMLDTMKNVKYDVKSATEKWGVKPDQMIDYLALVGDASDNVPGVKGIGPKGAQKLLGDFGTLEGIYENLDKITAKGTLAKLEESKELAILSKKLVTIATDVKMVVSLDELKLKNIDRDHLRAKLEELGFKSFERTLLGDSSAVTSTQPPTSIEETVQKSKSMGRALKKETSISATGVIETQSIQEQVVDLEGLRVLVPPYSDLWVLSDNRRWLFGLGNTVFTVEAELEQIGAVLQSKVLQWKGFDVKVAWKNLDIKDQHCGWDSMLAAYVIRAGNIGSFADICEQYLGRRLPELATAAQVYATHRELETALTENLNRVGGMDVYHRFELPTVPVLTVMEQKGIAIDPVFLKQQSETLDKDVGDLKARIYKEAGEEFNISSPKQLAQILFVKLGLPAGKKTKTGYSTNSDVLDSLKDKHDIVKHIVEYRELTKLKSTYVDALPELINPQTKKIHTHYRQAATSTGRLSSINPNLQNIPIRTERGRLIRKAFLPEPGHVFISVDYSQIELRVLAHITQDKNLIRAFQDDLDIHAATASEIFALPLDAVTDDLRRTAKAVNFGIAYGQGVFGLAETLGISRKESADIIERYFNRFAGVKKYMDEIVEQAKKSGYVETLFGRRRYIDELKAKNPALKKFGERAAINAPIQGTASDLVKLAMIRLYEEVAIPAVLQVHDEVLFECPEDLVEENIPIIKLVMESVARFDVPLKVNVAVGSTWDDAH
jgi:DNA polymerase-1